MIFKDVKIGQTFCISSTGCTCKKLSETSAIRLNPTLGGVDFQKLIEPKEFKVENSTNVYDIK